MPTLWVDVFEPHETFGVRTVGEEAKTNLVEVRFDVELVAPALTHSDRYIVVLGRRLRSSI